MAKNTKNPLRGASDKEQRQYEHIKESSQKSGRYGGRAKEVAARTVMKQRGRKKSKASGGKKKPAKKSAKKSSRTASSRSRGRKATSRSKGSSKRKSSSRSTR